LYGSSSITNWRENRTSSTPVFQNGGGSCSS
jgi:hypothetical protein